MVRAGYCEVSNKRYSAGDHWYETVQHFLRTGEYGDLGTTDGADEDMENHRTNGSYTAKDGTPQPVREITRRVSEYYQRWTWLGGD